MFIKRFSAVILVVLAAAESATREGVQHGTPEDVAHVPTAAQAQHRATHPNPSEQHHTAGSFSDSVPQPRLEGSSGTCINGDLQVGATDAAMQGPGCTDQHNTQDLTKQEELQQHHQVPRAPSHQAHVERPKRHPTIIPSPDEFERGQPDAAAGPRSSEVPTKGATGDSSGGSSSSGSGSTHSGSAAGPTLSHYPHPTNGGEPHLPHASHLPQSHMSVGREEGSPTGGHTGPLSEPAGMAEEVDDEHHVNLADADDGASIVAANKEAKKPEKAIDGDDDSYLKNSCSAQKWIIIELSQLGRIDELEIVNKEMYSSRLKDFTVRGRQLHPRKDSSIPDYHSWFGTDHWPLLGEFTAANRKGSQTFKIPLKRRIRYLLVQFHSHYGSEEVCALNSIRALGVSAAQELEDALAWHLHPDQLPSAGGMDASKELFDSLPLPEATHSQVNKSPQQQQHQGSAATHSHAQPHTATSHNHAYTPSPQQQQKQGSAAHAGREGGGVGGVDGIAGAAAGGSVGVGAGAGQGGGEGFQYGGGDGQHSMMDSTANGGVAAADGGGHGKGERQDRKEAGWDAGEGAKRTQGAHQDKPGRGSCAGNGASSSCGETSTDGGDSGGVNSDGNAAVGEGVEQVDVPRGQQHSTQQRAHESAGGETGVGEQPEEQGGSGDGRLEKQQAQGRTREDVQLPASEGGSGCVHEGVKGDASESGRTQDAPDHEGVSGDGGPRHGGEGGSIEASVGPTSSLQQQQQQQQQQHDADVPLGAGGAGCSTSASGGSGTSPAAAGESEEGRSAGPGCPPHAHTSSGSHPHPSGAQEQGSGGAAANACPGDPHARREGDEVPGEHAGLRSESSTSSCPCSQTPSIDGRGHRCGQIAGAGGLEAPAAAKADAEGGTGPCIPEGCHSSPGNGEWVPGQHSQRACSQGDRSAPEQQQQQQQQVHTDGRDMASAAGGTWGGPNSAEGDSVGGAAPAAAADAEAKQGHAHSSKAGAQTQQQGTSSEGVQAGGAAEPGLPQSLDGDLSNGSGLLGQARLPLDHPAAAADALQPHTENGGANSTASEQQAALDALHADHAESGAAAGSSSAGADVTTHPPMGLQQHSGQPSSSGSPGSGGLSNEDAQGQIPHPEASSLTSMHMHHQPGMASGGVPGGGQGNEDAQGQVPHPGASSMTSMHVPPQPGMASGGVPGGGQGNEDAQGQVTHSGASSTTSMHVPPQPGIVPGGSPGGVVPGGAPPDSPLAHIDHFLLAMEGGPTTRHRHANNLFDLFKQEFVLLRVNQTRIWKYINSLVDVLNKNAAEADEEVQRLERVIAEVRLEVSQVPAQMEGLGYQLDARFAPQLAQVMREVSDLRAEVRAGRARERALLLYGLLAMLLLVAGLLKQQGSPATSPSRLFAPAMVFASIGIGLLLHAPSLQDLIGMATKQLQGVSWR